MRQEWIELGRLEEESEVERLKRLERETIEGIRARGARFSASGRLPRERIHDRDALR